MEQVDTPMVSLMAMEERGEVNYRYRDAGTSYPTLKISSLTYYRGITTQYFWLPVPDSQTVWTLTLVPHYQTCKGVVPRLITWG